MSQTFSGTKVFHSPVGVRCDYCRGYAGPDGMGQCRGCGAPVGSAPASTPSGFRLMDARLLQAGLTDFKHFDTRRPNFKVRHLADNWLAGGDP